MTTKGTKGMLWGLLAALALGGTIARADVDGDNAVGGHGFSIGPRAVFSKPKAAREGKWFGGVQARFGTREPLAIEGSIDYRKNHLNDFVDEIVYPVQASLLIYLAPKSPVSPFILGGAGWYFTRIEVDNPIGNDFHHTDNRFGPHAGAGLEVALGPSVSLDASYRYVWLKSLQTRDQNELTADYNDSGYMVTIGLNAKF